MRLSSRRADGRVPAPAAYAGSMLKRQRWSLRDEASRDDGKPAVSISSVRIECDTRIPDGNGDVVRCG